MKVRHPETEKRREIRRNRRGGRERTAEKATERCQGMLLDTQVGADSHRADMGDCPLAPPAKGQAHLESK